MQIVRLRFSPHGSFLGMVEPVHHENPAPHGPSRNRRARRVENHHSIESNRTLHPSGQRNLETLRGLVALSAGRRELLGEGAEPGSGYWIQDDQGPSGAREIRSGHTVEWV